jgi:calcineurin-like phosphoesterase family protein
MSRLLRWLAVLAMTLALNTARAADLPGAWVELAADGGLDVRAVTMPGMACPRVEADAAALVSKPRGTADPADGAFPIQVCTAHAAVTTRGITVAGLTAPILPRSIKRVVVIGDTGCRLKGANVQDCNDPVDWPFATVARLAAARRPDLVIHVGDYHYRESPCPADRPGCAGSPYGDNWAVWQKDFFDPAAPLLAAAPWVLVRGNHEQCERGGHGWFRLLDPHPDVVECTNTTQPYSLHLDSLQLLMFDGADADDVDAQPAKVTQYRAQLQSLLSNAPAHSWLLTHRPVWALVQGKYAKPGDTINVTEQAAIRDLWTANLDMVLSGHIHDFTSYDFGPTHPAQFVVGEGGDSNDAIVQPLAAGITLDGARLRRGFGVADYGYVVLHRTTEGWSGTVYGITDKVLARCRLHGRALTCRSATQ